MAEGRPQGVSKLEQLHGEQLVLPLDWGRESWAGVSPRHLTRGSCVVDNSTVRCESREAREGCDPAQYTLFLKGKSYGS